MVFVHHTDTPNGTRPRKPRDHPRDLHLSRALNGWNDIGYNFLVDAYGRVFEGRAGGIDKPVIGLRRAGSTRAASIAVIGDGGRRSADSATRDARRG